MPVFDIVGAEEVSINQKKSSSMLLCFSLSTMGRYTWLVLKLIKFVLKVYVLNIVEPDAS